MNRAQINSALWLSVAISILLASVILKKDLGAAVFGALAISNIWTAAEWLREQR